jgi:hypothetical protein
MMNEFSMEELIPIVTELTEKYTSKESTSISYDTAKQLMNAVLYCINEYEFCFHELFQEKHNSLAQDTGARTAYNMGYKLVVKKVLKTKDLYEEILKDFNAFRNIAYYDTIIKGIPLFFINYDAKFNPQNQILTLDYPTIKINQELRGVDAVYEYLTYIKMEQDFLMAYETEFIVQVLTCYQGDYEELFINICSVVLRYVIGCMIVKKKISDAAGFNDADLGRIRNFVAGNTRDELEQKLNALLKLLVRQHYSDDKLLLEYLREDIINFSYELNNAAEHGCLAALFGSIE